MWHRVAGSPPLVFLGKISYGLYVYHVAVLSVVHVAFSRFIGGSESSVGFWLAEGVCAFFTTVIVSVISYQYLERPFLKLKSKHEMIKSRPI